MLAGLRLYSADALHRWRGWWSVRLLNRRLHLGHSLCGWWPFPLVTILWGLILLLFFIILIFILLLLCWSVSSCHIAARRWWHGEIFCWLPACRGRLQSFVLVNRRWWWRWWHILFNIWGIACLILLLVLLLCCILFMGWRRRRGPGLIMRWECRPTYGIILRWSRDFSSYWSIWVAIFVWSVHGFIGTLVRRWRRGRRDVALCCLLVVIWCLVLIIASVRMSLLFVLLIIEWLCSSVWRGRRWHIVFGSAGFVFSNLDGLHFGVAWWWRGRWHVIIHFIFVNPSTPHLRLVWLWLIKRGDNFRGKLGLFWLNIGGHFLLHIIWPFCLLLSFVHHWQVYHISILVVAMFSQLGGVLDKIMHIVLRCVIYIFS